MHRDSHNELKKKKPILWEHEWSIDSKESISPWNQEIKLNMSFTIDRKREGNKIKFLHRRSLQTYTHTHTHNLDDKARKTHTHTGRY